MTRETEDRMMQTLRRRKTDLEGQLGLADYGTSGWLQNSNLGAMRAQALSFMGKQYLCHQVFQGNYAWRPQLVGGIYTDTNLHFPLTRRILLQQIARAIAAFTGSDPWFTAYDVNISDEDLAKKVERWMRFEGDQSNLSSAVNQAIMLAFIQGQQVVETTHEYLFDYYRTYAVVAIDEGGNPLATKNGDYIYESDLFVPYSQTDAGKMQAEQAALAGASALPGSVLPPPDDLVLKRDGATPRPAQMRFERRLIDKRIEHKQGAKSENVNYMELLAPLACDDLQRADTVIRTYNEPVFALLGKLLTMDWKATAPELTPQEQLGRISDAMHLLIGAAGDGQLAGSKQSRDELQEAKDSQGVDTFEPLGQFCRSYTFFDIDGDGKQENLMVITDSEMRVPIYYDYLANVTWNGLRPLDVVRVNPVPNRWHGQSQVEVFGQLQEMIDLSVNRANFSQMSSGWIDFIKRSKLVNGDKIEINGGKVYDVRDDAQMAEVFRREPLYNTKYADIRDFIELLIQIAVNMSGVASANDARMANLDTGELATGIKNIEMSGDELFGVFLVDLKVGIEGVIENFGQTSILHMDKPRAFKYFEGELGRLATMTPEEVRDLKLDVDLALARARNLQDAQQGMAAWQIVKEFYTALPPMVQPFVLPLARRLLKAYQQKDADAIIQPIPVGVDPATGMPFPPPAGALPGQPGMAPGAAGAEADPAMMQPPASAAQSSPLAAAA